MAKIASYTKEQRDLIDQELEQLTNEQLSELETAGGRMIRQNNIEKQREYTQRYKRRIALAAQRGMFDDGQDAAR